MKNKTTILRFASLSAVAAAFVLVSGVFSQINAQRDPFAKASYMRVREPAKPGTGTAAGTATVKTGKVGGTAAPVNFGPPAIDSRIEYYKRLREEAAANGQPLPKVTSVLTLGEMNVTGIFKTPRGYAAMVEATPIKLTYTIYPGEKFFDGQLVAVEENKLVFRKVTKTGPGKFVSSVENMPLQTYTMRAQIEGTAPAQGAEKTTVAVVPTQIPGTVTAPGNMVSPLDEMIRTPVTGKTPAKAKKSAKRPQKAARGN